MVIIVITIIATYHLSSIYKLLGAGPGSFEWSSLNPGRTDEVGPGIPVFKRGAESEAENT